MKKKLFWIIYYCVAVFFLIRNAIVHSAEIHVSWFSLFPIVYIAFLIFWSLFITSKKAAECLVDSKEIWRAQNNRPLDTPPLPNADDVWKATKPDNQKYAQVVVAAIPFLIPFIYLYSDVAKFASLFFVFGGMLGGTLADALGSLTELKQHNNKRKKERIEQEKKEKLGKWK